jgi:hypothetical protein
MNSLRQERRFCDVTLILGGPGGPAAPPPLRFHGHRVVLAASSDFLRDKFLLHEGRSELCVGVVPHVEVGRRLLLSCYTGVLQFGPEEIVNYLTAASYLQMEHIVERCRGALKKYMLHRSPAPQPKVGRRSGIPRSHWWSASLTGGGARLCLCSLDAYTLFMLCSSDMILK